MTQENGRPRSEEIQTNPSGDAVRSLVRFLRLLNRRKAVMIYSLGVMALLAAIYYATATRAYTATGAVLVRQTGGDNADVRFSADRSTHDQMATYEQLLTSAIVLNGALSTMKNLPPEIDHRLSREAAVKRLREMLKATTLRRTSIIELMASSEDPAAAVQIVNAVIQAYLSYIDENHRSLSAEVIALLRKEGQELEQRLEQKEQELLVAQRNCADFGLSKHKSVVHPLVQNVIKLNDVVTDTKQKRIELETSLAALRNTIRSGGDLRQYLVSLEPMLGKDIFLDALGMSSVDVTIVRETEKSLRENRANLRQIEQHYGPAHPEVADLGQRIRNDEEYLVSIKQTMAEKVSGMQSSDLGAMLVSLIEEDLSRTWLKERQLVNEYQLAESQAIALNDNVAAMGFIERNVQRLRNLREALVSRIENIDINQNNVDVRVAVVSQPVESKDPVSPNLPKTGLFAVMLGLTGGAFIIYALDAVDDRFRSPEELQEYLSTRILAMIRKHQSLDGSGAQALQVNVSPDAVESEAFRTLRTTLAFSNESCRRIVVTSSEPSDGKTTVLSNLGASYAQSGRRTLLIDCDLRRPGLTTLFDMRTRPGVSEILRSQDEVDAIASQCIASTGVDGLDVLPSGRRPPDSSELLSRDRFADLIAWADAIYDQVLVDSPPMLAANDAAIVSRVVDGTLVVVRPEKNSRRAVSRTLEEVVALGANLLGVVVNGVDREQNDEYYANGGYGYGYGYAYGDPSHEHDNETDMDDLLLKFPKSPVSPGGEADDVATVAPRRRRAG